jgi:hypothetical protein
LRAPEAPATQLRSPVPFVCWHNKSFSSDSPSIQQIATKATKSSQPCAKCTTRIQDLSARAHTHTKKRRTLACLRRRAMDRNSSSHATGSYALCMYVCMYVCILHMPYVCMYYRVWDINSEFGKHTNKLGLHFTAHLTELDSDLIELNWIQIHSLYEIWIK